MLNSPESETESKAEPKTLSQVLRELHREIVTASGEPERPPSRNEIAIQTIYQALFELALRTEKQERLWEQRGIAIVGLDGICSCGQIGQHSDVCPRGRFLTIAEEKQEATEVKEIAKAEAQLASEHTVVWTKLQRQLTPPLLQDNLEDTVRELVRAHWRLTKQVNQLETQTDKE